MRLVTGGEGGGVVRPGGRGGGLGGSGYRRRKGGGIEDLEGATRIVWERREE